MHFLQATKVVHLPGILLLIFSAGAALAQGSLTPFVGADSTTQALVSTNQLLTPRKALLATERAREDITRGRFAVAQKELARALDIAPHCALALNLQGVIEMEAGDYKKGGERFQQAIDGDPTLGAAYLGMGMALIAQARYKDSLIPLDRAAALLPSAWFVYFEEALAHMRLGETQAAFQQAALADQFTGTDPLKISGVSYLRAIVYLKLNDPGSARTYLAEAVARDPNGYYAMLAKRDLERLVLVQSGIR